MEVYTAVSSCLTLRQQDPQLLGFRSYPTHPDSKGASHGACGEKREQTVLEHSSALSLGLRVFFWVLSCSGARPPLLSVPMSCRISPSGRHREVSRSHEAAQPSGQSRECARPGALATSWLFPASNVVGCLGLVALVALKADGPWPHGCTETPARATVTWTSPSWFPGRKVEGSKEGGRRDELLLGLSHSCPGLH